MKKKAGNIITAKITRTIFLIVSGFLALGAIGGVIGLMISPSGELIGIPLSEFKNIPFDSYLIPALLKKPESKIAEQTNIFYDMHWSWTFSVYIAIALLPQMRFLYKKKNSLEE
jgi:hypothetical protein